jgi:hypothetical protein
LGQKPGLFFENSHELHELPRMVVFFIHGGEGQAREVFIETGFSVVGR